MVWNDSNRTAVSGLFQMNAKTEDLLEDLGERGISQNQVSVLMTDSTRTRYADQYPELSESSKLPEGASLGGLSGGILGTILGALTMAGSVLIPGVNLLIAGPIVGAIAGGAAGVATGGLVGALVGAGIPEHEAKYYEDTLKNEGTVLIVAHVPSAEANDFKDLFKRHGAKDVNVEYVGTTTTTGYDNTVL